MYAEMPPAEKESWAARAEADKERYLHELSSYIPPAGYDAKGDAIITEAEYGMVKAPARRYGKVEKDVNAPKRNVSAYLLYQNAMRNAFKQENPGMTFGQLAKYTSCMYKNLTPEEKATWVTRAEEDKKRYDEQLTQYVPPPGHDARGNVIGDQAPKRRTKRGPKDPNAPKRASGAYVFFTNEMRPIVMEQHPGIKFVDMGRILGERWRALTPEEKTKYEAQSGEDKMRFQLEMSQYTANQAAAQQAAAAQQQQQQMQAMAHHQQQQMQMQMQMQQHGVPGAPPEMSGVPGAPPEMNGAVPGAAPEMHAGQQQQHQYIDPNQYHYPEYNHHSYT